MFGYIRKLWQALTGWMFEGKDQLNENKHVVKAVYEKSKVQQAERIRTITDAVSKLIGIKKGDIRLVKGLVGHQYSIIFEIA